MQDSVGRWLECVFPDTTGDFDQYGKIMKIMPQGLAAGDRNEDIPELISDINLKYRVEQGPVQRRVHTHAVLEIEHWSWIQIDYHKARDAIEKCIKEDLPNLPLQHKGAKRGVHIDFKYIGSSRPVGNYLLKDGGTFTGVRNVTAPDMEFLERMPVRPKNYTGPAPAGTVFIGDRGWVKSRAGQRTEPIVID